jgi:hypothetical protein
VTRAKFIMSGHVVNPNWTYQVDINTTGPSGRGGVGNAWIGHDCGDGHSVKFGTFKAPLLREELVDAQNGLAVERSNINYGFTAGYVNGLQYTYAAEAWRLMIAFSNGANSGGSSWAGADTDYAFTGRFEYLAMGTWDQFADFTSPQGSDQGLLLGLASSYQQVEYGTGSPTSGNEAFVITFDASYEADGWNLFGAFVFTDTQTGANAATTVNPWGFVVQGGFYINPEWELFGRYEFGDNDGTIVSPLDDSQSIITLGATRYFAGHNAQWTTDFGFALDTITAGAMAAPDNLTGWRADGNTDGQFVFRTQFQIMF